jgi:hypothetical protein
VKLHRDTQASLTGLSAGILPISTMVKTFTASLSGGVKKTFGADKFLSQEATRSLIIVAKLKQLTLF